jgi:SAM-dependent MidA family methyltransferase
MHVDLIGTAYLCDDPRAAADWFVEHIGFELGVDLGWYVNTQHPGHKNFSLDFVARDHGSSPEGLRGREVAGALVAFLVPDVEAEEKRLREAGLEARQSLDQVERFTGCLIANEVLDNVPFHRLRERDGRAMEVRVGADGDRLVEVEAQPAQEVLDLVDRPLRAGEERPVSPAAMALIEDLAGVLQRGYSFLFDYGFGGRVTPGPVHAYPDHQVLAEVLQEPGSRDVTAAVDFDLVAGTARRAELQVWGPVSQREALLALGYRMWTSGVRTRQAEAETAGDWTAANRLFEARSRASILIDERKLGSLWLLALGTYGLPPPAAARGEP